MVGFKTLKGVRIARSQATLKILGLQACLLEIEMK
jgi:hypothetical protein